MRPSIASRSTKATEPARGQPGDRPPISRPTAWLAALLLASGLVLAAGPIVPVVQGQPTPDLAGNGLPADPDTPTVKIKDAEEAALPAQPDALPPVLPSEELLEPAPPTAETGPAEPPMVPLHPGEPLMMRNWKALGWTAVLAAAFTAPTVKADAADIPPPPEPKPEMQQVLRELESLQRRLDGIVEANLKTQKAIQEAAAMRQDLEQLKAQVGGLQRKVDELARPPVDRVSNFAPAAPAAPMARLQLQNDYPTEVRIQVNNGQTFVVAPGATRYVEGMPAGRFTFQVLGLTQGPQTRDVGANETYLIRVFPG